MKPLYLAGDLHGYPNPFIKHLSFAGLIDDQQHWCGGDARVWIVGDFVDRGPDGVGCIDLVMRLQQEASYVGGQVGAVLGNHDIAFLAALLIPTQACTGPGGTFYKDWLRYGNPPDAKNAKPEHIEWLLNLPGMALVDDCLIIHGDCPLYLDLGSSLDSVNAAFRNVLHSEDGEAWDELLNGFNDHYWFYDDPSVTDHLNEFFVAFGGSTLIHGHTPIVNIIGNDPQSVTGAFVYAGGQAINVDSGLYKGGPGFIHRFGK